MTRRRVAFTLVELLVVIAIIAMLMAILLPVMRHANGTSVSYANGHSVRLMWRTSETILAGKNNTLNYSPTTCTGKNDLYNRQMRCWGQIGYTIDSACNYKLNDY